MQLDRFLRYLPLLVGGAVLLLSAVVAADSGLLGLLTEYRDAPWYTGLSAVLVGLCAIAAGAATRYTWPIIVMAFIGWLLIGLWPPIIVASFCAGMRARRPWLGLYLISTCAAMTLPIYSLSGGITGLYAVSAVIGFIVFLPALLGWLTYTRNNAMYELEVRALTAERNQLLREERARADERLAIAREMHDIVAHRVALITMHAGAMSMADKDPGTAHHAGLIRGLGRQALTELRQLLGVLRTPGSAPAALAGTADIDQLVEETQAAGLTVTLARTGTPRPLPEAAELAAYRIVQESLTNVAKHAGTPPTAVTLDYGQTSLTATVTNDAPNGHSFELPSGGLGLIGLSERVALMHGTFDARALPSGGFTLQATLPIPEPTDS